MKYLGAGLSLFLILFLATAGPRAANAAEKNWAGVAADIEKSLREAVQIYGEEKREEAMERIADSYFGLFEAQEANMEIAVRRFISLRGATRLEKGFNDIRRAMHKGVSLTDIRKLAEDQIKDLHDAADQLDKKGIGLDVSFQ